MREGCLGLRWIFLRKFSRVNAAGPVLLGVSHCSAARRVVKDFADPLTEYIRLCPQGIHSKLL